jgi:HAD superfamily hydrolase (TIGR01490 family)
MKVALFDFCETLVGFQTADAYVRFVMSNSQNTNRSADRTFNFLNKVHLVGLLRRLMPTASVEKKLRIKNLKGMSKEELESLAQRYYTEKLKPAFILPVLEELKKKKQEGYKIYLVSGGYDIYLRRFAEEFGVDGIVSTRLEFKNGICTGKFDGPDCMFSHKINYIKQLIPDSDYREWYAYSDSATDLPMLKLVGHPVAVSAAKSQSWAKAQGFDEIIC